MWGGLAGEWLGSLKNLICIDTLETGLEVIRNQEVPK
jgi:hypothetical protein